MKKQTNNNISGVLGRIAVVLVTAILVIAGALYGVMWVVVKGPSPTAARLFVLSVKETSAGGFLANLFLSEDEINAILNADSSELTDDITDTSLIQIQRPQVEGDEISGGGSVNVVPSGDGSSDGDGSTDEDEIDNSGSLEGIEVLDIKGSTYNGKLMIIEDPSRVFVGVPDAYGEGESGLTVAAMIEKYNCVAGTNAGGFDDPNGQGTGGIPDGIIIYEGELLWGKMDESYSLAGLDANGILHVGVMTGAHALDIGIQYAASYGPALVVNGAPSGAYIGGGLNPRTAIGQRADGAILLLVINGRSVDSLGATLDDLASIMIEHGAVNASNLDGGSSSIMIMEGEYLTSSAYIFGERVVASAILVR